MDSAIQLLNNWGLINHYPVNSAISLILIHCTDIYPINNSIQLLNNWGLINHYPVDSAIGFPNINPMDSDLSGGERYPTFEQPGPDRQSNTL